MLDIVKVMIMPRVKPTNRSYKLKLVVLAVLSTVLVIVAGWVVFYRADRTISESCEKNAKLYLKKVNAKYPFERCTQKILTTDTGEKLAAIHVVAGEVEERWEFECGFNVACTTSDIWVDYNGHFVEMGKQPEVINDDPAVSTLGCTAGTSGSNEKRVKPKLIYENEKFWWQIDYDKVKIIGFGTASDIQELPYCIVDGTSKIRGDQVLSGIKVDYKFSDTCKDIVKTGCMTRKALLKDDPEQCNLKKDIYDWGCAENYTAQTNNRELCDAKSRGGTRIDCSAVVPVTHLD